ncbi:UNVERIFIED_CONTAM: hypothetical protein K2H54_048439 [Gekko kuhli]
MQIFTGHTNVVLRKEFGLPVQTSDLFFYTSVLGSGEGVDVSCFVLGRLRPQDWHSHLGLLPPFWIGSRRKKRRGKLCPLSQIATPPSSLSTAFFLPSASVYVCFMNKME